MKAVGHLGAVCYVEGRHRQVSGAAMGQRPVSTERVAASRARQDWSQLLERVQSGRVRILVEKSGVPVAALIAPEDLARFEKIEAELDAALARMRAAFADLTDEQIEQDIADVIAEVRTARRAAQSASVK